MKEQPGIAAVPPPVLHPPDVVDEPADDLDKNNIALVAPNPNDVHDPNAQNLEENEDDDDEDEDKANGIGVQGVEPNKELDRDRLGGIGDGQNGGLLKKMARAAQRHQEN